MLIIAYDSWIATIFSICFDKGLTPTVLQPTAFFENKFYINLCWWKSDGHCIDTSRLYCELVQFCLDFCLSRIKLINVEILSIRKMNICATMPNISVIRAQTINQSLIMYWKISCDDPNHYYWLNQTARICSETLSILLDYQVLSETLSPIILLVNFFNSMQAYETQFTLIFYLHSMQFKLMPAPRNFLSHSIYE